MGLGTGGPSATPFRLVFSLILLGVPFVSPLSRSLLSSYVISSSILLPVPLLLHRVVAVISLCTSE